MKNDEDIADELLQIEHVVIDEAQDLVGQRADLIEALVGRLPSDCGITVFADEAQAIYGFSDNSIGSRRKRQAANLICPCLIVCRLEKNWGSLRWP